MRLEESAGVLGERELRALQIGEITPSRHRARRTDWLIESRGCAGKLPTEGITGATTAILITGTREFQTAQREGAECREK
jgi:hypothetical protein